MIHTVYYRSFALLASTTDLDAEIEGILRVARERNGNDGITGALVFSDHRFFQVLEGPRLAVERTIERIGRDPRHGQMAMLYTTTRLDRRFGGWSMAYVGADPALLDRCRDFTMDTLPVLNRVSSAGVLRQMVEGAR